METAEALRLSTTEALIAEVFKRSEGDTLALKLLQITLVRAMLTEIDRASPQA